MASRICIKEICLDGKLHRVDISDEYVRTIMCYPYHESSLCKKILPERIKIIKDANIEYFIEYGNKLVGKMKVLGKGWSAITTLSIHDNNIRVTKIRRLDSRRGTLEYEAIILEYLSPYNISPRVYLWNRDIIVMDYIKGPSIDDVINSLIAKNDLVSLRRLLKKLLIKAWLLDILGIDHGELSRASGHVICDEKLHEIYFIDFESAGYSRKIHNATSIASYVLFRTKISKLLDEEKRLRIINKLRQYKTDYFLGHLLEIPELVVY